jgi:hypothetical protein
VPQSLGNQRKVLCGGKWKKVAMIAPLWRDFRREEVVCEFGAPNKYWKADEADSIHHFFGNVRFIAVLSVFQLLYDLAIFFITLICCVIA